jgi:hypothetical protein
MGSTREVRDGGLERALAALGRFSEAVAGERGRLLHLLHLELIQPGAGVWFQQEQVDDDAIPPWPQGDETDPLEDGFGSLADNLRLLTPEELDDLRGGGEPTGARPEPDLTKPGGLGSWAPRIPSDEWPYRMTWHLYDDTWKRIGVPLPPCGRLWIFEFNHSKRVPACANLNYARDCRATLLRAFAEAFRSCRARDPQCPDARLWMLGAHWGCVIDAGRPTLDIGFKFAVACVAA